MCLVPNNTTLHKKGCKQSFYPKSRSKFVHLKTKIWLIYFVKYKGNLWRAKPQHFFDRKMYVGILGTRFTGFPSSSRRADEIFIFP